MRSFEKAAQQGQELIDRHPNIDISAAELYLLINQYRDKPDTNTLMDIITAAFYAGLGVGHRNK